MSANTSAIRVNSVSKRFELYAKPRDRLKQLLLPRLRKFTGRPDANYFQEFWALRDVSLDVYKGESCGIVGLNGSGKSTLLQIIAGILEPTSGYVETCGRIAALLELGSGFNPEFTGRENVFMNGALLGLSREQVIEKIEAIQAFADIGAHFDQPLKSYSTGMQMRVAFSVATSFNPDILIIDEALAVGDAFFQQKCFYRLESFRAAGGTILFVSHDANTVKHLCDKALFLDQGRVVMVGPPKSVIDNYQGLIHNKANLGESDLVIEQGEDTSGTWSKATSVTTNNDADLIDFKLLDSDGNEVSHIESDQVLKTRYIVRLNKDFDRPAFGIIIRDRLGRSIYEVSTYAMRMAEQPVVSGKLVVVDFVFNLNLRAGQYSFSIGVANRGYGRSEFEEYSLLMHDVEQLQVTESSNTAFYGGIFDMKPTASIALQEDVND